MRYKKERVYQTSGLVLEKFIAKKRMSTWLGYSVNELKARFVNSAESNDPMVQGDRRTCLKATYFVRIFLKEYIHGNISRRISLYSYISDSIILY